MNDKYPILLMMDGNPIFKLRKDEVYFESGKQVHQIGDACERLFWEKSNAELIKLKDTLKANESVLEPLGSLTRIIEKILAQRKFIQDNEAFRNALIPE